MSTGTTRILIVIALAVAGLVVLVNGFSGAGGLAGSEASSSPSPSGHTTRSKSPKPPVAHQSPKKISFFVLNGTPATGLAAQWEQRLANKHFKPALNTAGFAVNDAPSKPLTKTIVYYRGGAAAAQNRADARFVADTYLNGAPVKQLAATYSTGTLVPAAANVVIVLGADASSVPNG